MTSTKVKTLLLILLICLLTGMLLALGSPEVLSAGITALSGPTQEAQDRQLAEAQATETTAAASATPSAQTATPAATKTALAAVTATPDGDGWFSAVETVYVSPGQDHWDYSSLTLGIEIKKVVLQQPVPLVYYTAEVFTKEEQPLRPCFAGDDTSGKTRLLAAEIACQHQAVLAVTADGFTTARYQKGTVIRMGKLVFEKGKADTLAILPDGALGIFSPEEATAESLLAMGVQNTYSYGPMLIRGGALNDAIGQCRGFARSARAGIGMIEPGHYVIIVVDGCDDDHSVGVTLSEFTALFRPFRVKQAYNLDGGDDAVLCFLGEKLNGLPGQRQKDGAKMTDVIGIGQSELVKME